MHCTTVKKLKGNKTAHTNKCSIPFPLPGCIWHWPRVWFPSCHTEEAYRKTPQRVAAVQKWLGTWPAGSPGRHRWPAAGREERNKHCWHPPQDCILHNLAQRHITSWDAQQREMTTGPQWGERSVFLKETIFTVELKSNQIRDTRKLFFYLNQSNGNKDKIKSVVSWDKQHIKVSVLH